jgi:L-rhamnose mutarotase
MVCAFMDAVRSVLWPEMHTLLKSHGVHNYSIFLHAPSSTLFAYAEIESEVHLRCQCA